MTAVLVAYRRWFGAADRERNRSVRCVVAGVAVRAEAVNHSAPCAPVFSDAYLKRCSSALSAQCGGTSVLARTA